jgi:exosortase
MHLNKYLIWILLSLGVIAHLPLVIAQLSFMWGSETFQYFPFAIVAAGAVLYVRWEELSQKLFKPSNAESDLASFRPNGFVLAIAMILNVSILALAIISSFSWLGWISFILFLVNFVYGVYGWSGLKILFPAALVLLAIRPVPEFLELSLTISMQRFASQISGLLLDAIGILHYRQGVVLVLPEQSFMAEEACSGIRSLFSSITAILVWGLMNRYHWLRNIFNILQTLFWVVIFNAIRITVVVWVEDRTDFSVATGWQHDVLGLVIFFLIFATTLSTNQLLGVFLRLPEDADDEPDFAQTSTPSGFKSIIDQLNWYGSPAVGIVWCCLFGLLALVSLRLTYLTISFEYDSIANERELVEPVKEFLPEQISEWRTVSFKHEHRSENHTMGSDSYIWTLVNKNNKSVLLSVDGVFNDYHELATCYANLGWDVSTDQTYGKGGEESGIAAADILDVKDLENSELNLTKLDLMKHTGESGQVLFTAVDRNGKTVVPPPAKTSDILMLLQEKAIGTFRALMGKQSYAGSREAFFLPPVSTIQMVYQPNSAVTEEDAAEIRSLFLKVREILRSSPRFASQKSS